MDTIKTTIELGGITMTYPDDDGRTKISRTENCACTYAHNLTQSFFEKSLFAASFYIECKDDPSKLHKFCEMKYLGLVDNPHYHGVGDLLREMVKKFDGCVVYADDNGFVLVARNNIVRLGCYPGVMEVLGRVFTGLRYASGAGITGVSFNRIDASKIPSVWAWPSSYDKDIRAMCEQLKDMEP